MSLQSPGLIVTESGRPLEPDVPIRDGTLISCAFRAVGNAPPGTYALHAADAVVVDQNGNRWPAATSDGAITIEAGPLIACAGDCDGDGGVSVDELVKAVRVVLLDEPVGFCASVDRDDDTVVTVDDLIAGVLNALRGCNFE